MAVVMDKKTKLIVGGVSICLLVAAVLFFTMRKEGYTQGEINNGMNGSMNGPNGVPQLWNFTSLENADGIDGEKCGGKAWM